jgi:AraC-like DNA-binding protein
VGSHPARQLQSWEIIFVEKGTLTIREGQTVFCVNAGESLLLWPRLHIGVGQFPADLKFYWLHFEVTAENDASITEPLLAIPQHTRWASPIYYFAVSPVLTRAGKYSSQHGAGTDPAADFAANIRSRQRATCRQPRNALAWKAQQIIHTRFHLPISASTLAKELHCNADYLGRVFRGAFRLTLTEALHRQRVRAAEKLLISDSLSLTEVAMKCGFNDVGYFRKIFHKHTSLTPAAWKRRYCKEHINSA